jgi:Short C-terminal domain
MVPSVLGSLGRYVFTLGLWHIWRKRNYLVLTTERVWLAHGRFIWKQQRSLPLAKVQDATYKKNLFYGGVTVTTAGGVAGTVRKTWFSNAEARVFVEELNGLLRAPTVVQADPGQSRDHAGELRKLAELREESLITPEEFDAKRSEILSAL